MNVMPVTFSVFSFVEEAPPSAKRKMVNAEPITELELEVEAPTKARKKQKKKKHTD